jgi:HEAT repeat protein
MVQRLASEHFIRLSKSGPSAGEALIAALSHPNPRLRWGAAYTLSRLEGAGSALGGEAGELSARLVEILAVSLGDEDSDLRWASAKALVGLLQKNEGVRPRLLWHYHRGNPTKRRMCLYCLRDLGWEDARVLDVLSSGCRDEERGVRLAALSALPSLGRASALASGEAIRLLREDPDEGVRRAATAALSRLAPHLPAARTALEEAARGGGDGALRRAARAALFRSGLGPA